MDQAELAKLYGLDGPFVSIYLDCTSAVEAAAPRLETRWKNVLRELTEHGVDAATREALTEARGGHESGNTRVLVAAQHRVQLATWLPEPPPQDVVRVAALPHLLPLLDALQLRIPHVVVLADREGADVLAYTSGPDPAERTSLEGQRWPVHRAHAGGWSTKRYDATVENSWEATAREVATLVDNVARDVGAHLVIGSGDVRALQLLAEHLPAGLADRWVTVEGGGRAVDGSDEVLGTRVLQAVADRVALETLALVNRFIEEKERQERACEGVGATVAALRMAQVGTLLLTDGFADTRPAWFGPDPSQLALDEESVRALGVHAPRQAPLVDVLLRAALCTAAEVRMVSSELAGAPSDGIGALLRFPPPPG